MAYALSIFSTKVKIASSSCGWESSTLKKKNNNTKCAEVDPATLSSSVCG